MYEVYTTVPGLELQIGVYGLATNDTPAIVPDDVADQLEDEIRGYFTKDGERHKYARGANNTLRVKKVAQPAAPPQKLSAADVKHAQPAGKGEKE